MANSRLQELFNSFGRSEATAILVEAGVAEKGIAGQIDVSLAPEPILAALLRRRTISDEQFVALVNESGIVLEGRPRPETVKVRLSFPTTASQRVPITDLTAASILVWEVTARVAAILNLLSLREEDLKPPEVEVSPGSVAFSLGGSTLLVSGVAFVIASHAQMLPQNAALLTYYGGALLFSVGLLDLAINWYKTIQDGIKADSETQLNRVKLRQAEQELSAAQNKTSGPPAALAPASSRIALQFGIPESLAVHLLNRVLPAVHDLSISSGQPSVTVSSEGGTGTAKVMSASG